MGDGLDNQWEDWQAIHLVKLVIGFNQSSHGQKLIIVDDRMSAWNKCD